MWKFIPRGVRQTIERLGRVKQQETQNTFCKEFYCSSDDYKDGSKTEAGKKKFPKPDNCPFLGAVSFSGALALGWVLSQPCIWRKCLTSKDRYQSFNTKGPLDLLTVTALSQPIVAKVTEDLSNLQFINDSGNSITYGPKTADEALDEAAEEFKLVHNKILAEVENRRGVDLLSAKKNKEAFLEFLSACQRGYTPAAYNLAQCYELGLGTKQDFVEAAKWYEVAAEQGHPNALYNLGVFYAHGWGGLKPSSKKARQLLSKAAQKGQPDAKAALGLHDKSIDSPTITELAKDTSWNSNTDEFSRVDKNISNDPKELYDLANLYEKSVCYDPFSSQLVITLYKMASDLGHVEAKAKLYVLEAFDSIGLLSEYMCEQSKREHKSEVLDCSPLCTY